MAGKKLDVQKIEEVDANEITRIAGEKRIDQSADMAKALVDNPAFVDNMKGIILNGSIEFKGDIVENKVLTPKSVSVLYDRVLPFMANFPSADENFRGLMALTYSYYVLKMAQDSYDQLPPDDKAKVKKYSIWTVDDSGAFQIKFVDGKDAEVAQKVELDTPVKEVLRYQVVGNKITVENGIGGKSTVYEIVTEGVKVNATLEGVVVTMGDSECKFVADEDDFVVKNTSSDKKQLAETHDFNIVEEGDINKIEIVKKAEDDKKAEEGPEKFGGVKCKPKKSFDNLANLLENLKINLESFEGDVPKDLNFEGGEAFNELLDRLKIQFVAIENVENYKDFVEEIFEQSSPPENFNKFFAKAATAYYMKKVDEAFKKEYTIDPTLKEVFGKRDDFKIDYSLTITDGDPKIEFKHSAEFDKAHRASNELKAALDSEAPKEAGDYVSRKAALQGDSLISMLASMSGDDAILEKISKKQTGTGFFGFLISIIAGIKGIEGFEDSWATVRGYAPKEAQPFLDSVEKTVKERSEEFEKKKDEIVAKNNEEIIKLSDKQDFHKIPSSLGLVFKDDFDLTQNYECLEVNIPKGKTVSFKEGAVPGKIVKIVLGSEESDFTVSDSNISDEGTYKIYGKIPAGTKFDGGIKIRLVKKKDASTVVADKPAGEAEVKPAEDAEAKPVEDAEAKPAAVASEAKPEVAAPQAEQAPVAEPKVESPAAALDKEPATGTVAADSKGSSAGSGTGPAAGSGTGTAAAGTSS